jgi:hypothetical protein
MSKKEVDALSSPATLAEVLDRLAGRETLARQRQLDLMSGVRQIARLLGAVPADAPADPQALRQRLRLLTPAGAGMKPSRLGMSARAPGDCAGSNRRQNGARTPASPSDARMAWTA